MPSKYVELRAAEGDLGPPASLCGEDQRPSVVHTHEWPGATPGSATTSGADERVSSAPKMAERAPVPPDPIPKLQRRLMRIALDYIAAHK